MGVCVVKGNQMQRSLLLQQKNIGLAYRLLCVFATTIALLPLHASAQALRSGEQVYQAVCVACHQAGVANAPKFGDRAAWGKLIKEGQPMLTGHAWVGVRGMPAKGGQADLSLEEFSRAVAFMARAAGADWKDPDDTMLAKIRAEEKKRLAGAERRK